MRALILIATCIAQPYWKVPTIPWPKRIVEWWRNRRKKK